MTYPVLRIGPGKESGHSLSIPSGGVELTHHGSKTRKKAGIRKEDERSEGQKHPCFRSYFWGVVGPYVLSWATILWPNYLIINLFLNFVLHKFVGSFYLFVGNIISFVGNWRSKFHPKKDSNRRVFRFILLKQLNLLSKHWYLEHISSIHSIKNHWSIWF